MKFSQKEILFYNVEPIFYSCIVVSCYAFSKQIPCPERKKVEDSETVILA
ncbi:UNVERIFIED_CONTAM: hypothetical protein FKN15_053944 [Acipenser sinensis]